MQVRVVRQGDAADWSLSITDGARVADLLEAVGALPAGQALGPSSARQVVVDDRSWPLDAPLADTGISSGSEVLLDPAPADGPGDVAHVLTTLAGPDAGRRVPLAPGSTVIGRAADAGSVDDPSLSRHHLSVTVETDPAAPATVEDLASTNGTWLGTTRVTTPARLEPGGVVRAGLSQLRLEPAPPPSRVATAGPHHRPPRAPEPPAPEPLHPPATPRDPERPRLALATLAVPLATGAALALLYGPHLAVIAVIGPVVALGGWLAARHAADRAARAARRTHDAALDQLRVDADERRAMEEDARRRAQPALHELVDRGLRRDPLVWERRRDHHDFLRLSVGPGSVAWRPAVVTAPDAAAAAVLDSVGPLRDVPITVDGHALIGVVGPHSLAVAVARSLALQAAVLHGPADVRMLVVTSPAHADHWMWARWLPHTIDPHDDCARSMAIGPVGAHDLVVSRTACGEGPVEWWIVDGDDDALARTSALRAVLTDRDVRACGLVLAERREHLPSTCATVIEVGRDGSVVVQRFEDGSAPQAATLVGCSTTTAEAVARRLAGLRDPDLGGASGALPDRCALLPLLEIEPTASGVERRWARTRGTDELVVPIGADGDGPVDVDLVRDGPHVLVAGTTGSGKSELLRSLVAALAASADVEHCNLVLIDFKGGAAFDRLRALPHVVGCVTDLDEHLAARALRCLDAELRRRERLLRDAGTSDITAYVRERRRRSDLPPLPRLVVVVDEFATLVADLPEFVDSLVDTAQRGRSLGVHLVLATQRPAGAVKDSIRTNTNLRIALRVVEPTDSRDVLGADDAARLPRHRPGRAVLRSGDSDLRPFQAAHVGSTTASRRPRAVEARPWSPVSAGAASPGHRPAHGADAGEASDLGDASDLDRLVAAICDAHIRAGHAPPRRPWPDPLPACVTAADLDAADAFALLDEPDEQRCSPLSWDPASGNVLVAGLAGSGVTTTLAAVALALVRSRAPDAVHLYAVTTDRAALAPLERTAHCGAVVAADDCERVVLLLRRLDEELRRRRAEPNRGAPLIVTVLDGISTMRAELEDRGLPDEVDLLERLVADGPAAGLVFAFGAEHPSAIGHRLERTAPHRLLLRLPERGDYVAIGLHGIDPHRLPPGRGFLADGAEVQVARPHERDWLAVASRGSATIGRARPWAVPRLPEHVPTDQVGAAHVDDGALIVPFGLGQTLRPVALTLRDGDHALITGAARTGKTSTLRTIARQLDANRVARVVNLGGRSATRVDVEWLRELVASLIESDERVVVLVDDADVLDDGGALVPLVQPGRPGLHVIATGRSDRFRSLFRHWTAEVRRSRLALLLRGDELDGDLVGARVPRRSPAPWRAGRGWLVTDDGVELCQVAHGDPDPGLRTPENQMREEETDRCA